MSKILLVHAGTDNKSTVTGILADKHEVVETFDKTKGETKEGAFYLDYLNRDEMQQDLKSIFPVDNIIIESSLSLTPEGFYSESTEYLNKLFCIMKSLYPLMMRLRGTGLWLLEPDITIPAGSSLDAKVRTIKAGVKAISQISSMELARKKVAVNYLGNHEDFKGIEKLITWSVERKNIYVTAQILNP